MKEDGRSVTVEQEDGSSGVDTAGSSGVGVVGRVDEKPNGGPNPLYHDGRGRFRPGNPGGRRAPRATERAYLEAVTAKYSPSDVVKLIDRAIALAEQHQAPRQYLEAARLLLEYTIGKPIARSVSLKAKWEEMMYDDATVDSDVVDAKDD